MVPSGRVDGLIPLELLLSNHWTFHVSFLMSPGIIVGGCAADSSLAANEESAVVPPTPH